MEKKPLIDAGRIVNTHGVRGEVKIEVWLDSPRFLKSFKRLTLDSGEELNVLDAKVHKGFVIAKLEGVDDVNAAMRLKGKTLSVRREDAALPKGAFFLQDIINARVRDEDGNEIPKSTPETVGELCVKGPGVMICYYKNKKATDECLKDGWLYTGDMAKYDKDGFIWLVDRKKDVIISGGENIYPVQIESFLMKHPAIQDVAVIGIGDERLGEISAAIIQLKNGKLATEEEIRASVEESFELYAANGGFAFEGNFLGPIKDPDIIRKNEILLRVASEIGNTYYD